MKLTDRQIEYGFTYYFKEESEKIKTAVEVSDFKGEEKLYIHCTQLGDVSTPQYKTPKEKKRVLVEWRKFLQETPTAFTELYFNTKMPQELFDAVCCQKNLKRLEIKWGTYKDIAAIEQLTNLELLSIGSGSSVESIKPLTKLLNLSALCVENFQNISCYNDLSTMTQLEYLSIMGDGLGGPQYIKLDDINFISKMTQLRFFRLLTERLTSKDYTPILELQQVEHLSLSGNKEVKKLYSDLIKLPKLKWGFLKSNPDMYMKKLNIK